MKVLSFILPPCDGKYAHQLIDLLLSILGGVGYQVGIFTGRQYAAMAKDFFHLKQVNTRLD